MSQKAQQGFGDKCNFVVGNFIVCRQLEKQPS